MIKTIKQNFKKNILMLSIIITIIFLIINFALYIINDNYLDNKIKKENDQFLQITRHIINENEIEVALEYVIHYTHIHEVEIEIMDENQNMLFSSEVSHRYSNQYQLVTLKGTFTVFIDNTDSITVNSVRLNSLYINISLVIIYVFSLVILIRNDKINSNQLDHDLKTVLKLIDNNNENTEAFHYFEFQKIYMEINKYLENIDLWLPRNIEGTLTITQGELTASKLISTASGEPTCETTMKLT